MFSLVVVIFLFLAWRTNDLIQSNEPLATISTLRPQLSLVPIDAGDTSRKDALLAKDDIPDARGLSADRRVRSRTTLPHPSCIAEQFIRQYVKLAPVSLPHKHKTPRSSTKGPRPTPQPLPPLHEYWREYVRPENHCFKHGGHSPGMPRSHVDVVTGDVSHGDQYRRLELRNVLSWKGDLYQQADSDETVQFVTHQFASYFPMVGGNWPQPVIDTVTVKLVKNLSSLVTTLGARRIIERGYLQPPTDFGSVYHTVVETILPAFQTVREISRASANSRPAVSVLMSRPRTTQYFFKAEGCALSFERCLDTVWGSMYLAVTVGLSNPSLLRSILLHPKNISSVLLNQMTLGPKHDLGESPAAIVYGLRKSEQQLRQYPSSSTHPFQEDVDDVGLLFGTLYVGNPTHCEPLWGGDPHYAEAVAHRHHLRGTFVSDVEADHRLRDASTGKEVSLPTDIKAHFDKSFHSCQTTLWSFRRFLVDHSPPEDLWRSESTSWKREPHTPIIAGRRHPVRIVFTSRKGDWARQILNEDDVVEALRAHLKVKYHSESTVTVAKFRGDISSQIWGSGQLDMPHTTVFIGNHGANLLNSIFLRPNAGLITLSLRNPGFYPFSLLPDWLHCRDMVASQMCNRRLNKGKCRWSEGNNNDMQLSDKEIALLLKLVDDVVEQQEVNPRSAYHDGEV